MLWSKFAPLVEWTHRGRFPEYRCMRSRACALSRTCSRWACMHVCCSECFKMVHDVSRSESGLYFFSLFYSHLFFYLKICKSKIMKLLLEFLFFSQNNQSTQYLRALYDVDIIIWRTNWRYWISFLVTGESRMGRLYLSMLWRVTPHMGHRKIFKRGGVDSAQASDARVAVE